MQLVRALLIAASIVVLLSGISILFGSTKQEKGSALRFLLATVGSAIWTVAIIIFLHMPHASSGFVHVIVTCIIAGVTLSDIGLLSYLSWQYKHGKVLTLLFSAVGVALVALLSYDSSIFYSAVDLTKDYTILSVEHNWYYYTLIIYFFLISITFSYFLQKRIKITTNRGLKTGLIIFYVGLSIGGILGLIFNLILIASQPHLVWIGPLSTIIPMMTFYLSVVKYRTLNMSSKWMEILSYIILIITAIIFYLLAFYAVFTALFGIPNPSSDVLVLNIIMAIFLILLMPTLSEIANFMMANYYNDKINLGYITKKIEGITKATFDPRDTAKFLADTLHYSYIMFIINGHSYASNDAKLSTMEIEELSRLKKPENSIWINVKSGITIERNISKIGIFTDKNGNDIGKIVFGKHHGETTSSRRDQIKQEEIIGMISCIIEEKRKR